MLDYIDEVYLDEIERKKEEQQELYDLLGLSHGHFVGKINYADVVKLKDYEATDTKLQTVYSDRLYQWNSEKYDKCCKKVWNNTGQLFEERSKHPENIQTFLSLYFEKDCDLVAVLTTTNVSTGFPLSCFFYVEKD